MSGYGHQIQVILNNNKRKRPSAFKKMENCGGLKRKLYFSKKASPLQLKEIKEKILKENKKTVLKNILFILIIISILIYAIGFVIF